MKKRQSGGTAVPAQPISQDIINNDKMKSFADMDAERTRKAAHAQRQAEFAAMNAKQNAVTDEIGKTVNTPKKQYGGPNPTQPTAAVINNYSKKAPYGKPGGPSYNPQSPAPAFKKGGSKKK